MIITYLVETGEEKVFAHPIDAAEWEAAGLVTFTKPGDKPAPKPEPAEYKGAEATDAFAAPDILKDGSAPVDLQAAPAPKKRAPRRRPS